MCRFIAFLGKNPIVLDRVLVKPTYSLVKQSRNARIGLHHVNADGFGVAWYDLAISPEPGLFHSIQPAWNDENLKHMAALIQSTCFLSHVRASTVGDVSRANCHPFSFGEYSMVHNGHIAHFEEFRRELIGLLDDELYNALKGRTDSEHLFFLIMQYLREAPNEGVLNAIRRAFAMVAQWHAGKGDEYNAVLNIVLSDGKQLFVARYVSESHEPASLYYATGAHASGSLAQKCILEAGNTTGAVIVASEPLNDTAGRWHELAPNHFLVVDEALNIDIQAV